LIPIWNCSALPSFSSSIGFRLTPSCSICGSNLPCNYPAVPKSPVAIHMFFNKLDLGLPQPSTPLSFKNSKWSTRILHLVESFIIYRETGTSYLLHYHSQHPLTRSPSINPTTNQFLTFLHTLSHLSITHPPFTSLKMQFSFASAATILALCTSALALHWDLDAWYSSGRGKPNFVAGEVRSTSCRTCIPYNLAYKTPLCLKTPLKRGQMTRPNKICMAHGPLHSKCPLV
jgi:hypothetical protein